jgi:hypothetical protein
MHPDLLKKSLVRWVDLTKGTFHEQVVNGIDLDVLKIFEERGKLQILHSERVRSV